MDDFTSHTVLQLKTIAKNAHLTGYSQLHKADLISLLETTLQPVTAAAAASAKKWSRKKKKQHVTAALVAEMHVSREAGAGSSNSHNSSKKKKKKHTHKEKQTSTSTSSSKKKKKKKRTKMHNEDAAAAEAEGRERITNHPALVRPARWDVVSQHYVCEPHQALFGENNGAQPKSCLNLYTGSLIDDTTGHVRVEEMYRVLHELHSHLERATSQRPLTVTEIRRFQEQQDVVALRIGEEMLRMEQDCGNLKTHSACNQEPQYCTWKPKTQFTSWLGGGGGGGSAGSCEAKHVKLGLLGKTQRIEDVEQELRALSARLTVLQQQQHRTNTLNASELAELHVLLAFQRKLQALLAHHREGTRQLLELKQHRDRLQRQVLLASTSTEQRKRYQADLVDLNNEIAEKENSWKHTISLIWDRQSWWIKPLAVGLAVGVAGYAAATYGIGSTAIGVATHVAQPMSKAYPTFALPQSMLTSGVGASADDVPVAKSAATSLWSSLTSVASAAISTAKDESNPLVPSSAFGHTQRR